MLAAGFVFTAQLKLQNELVSSIYHGQSPFFFLYINLSFLILFSAYLANASRTETQSKKEAAIKPLSSELNVNAFYVIDLKQN